MSRSSTTKISESQNAPDYSGVVRCWGRKRLAVSPTGRRYLIQEYVPEANSFRIVHWAKTGSKLAQRAPELRKLIAKGVLPENPAEAAPETVAKRAAEDRGGKAYPEFRCDYDRVIVQEGRLRIAISPDADAYLWQAAATYSGTRTLRPNTWRTIFRSSSASGLEGHIAEARIIWPSHFEAEGKPSKLEMAIAHLPERPLEVTRERQM